MVELADRIQITMGGETLQVIRMLASLRGCSVHDAIKGAVANELWLRQAVPVGGTISVRDSAGKVKRERTYI